MHSSCPCCSGRAFDACCEPVLAGMPARTAESLMRSRYTAFAVGDAGYLETTSSGQAAVDFDRAAFEAQMAETEWLGLEIKSTRDGGEDDASGMVTFAARYRYGGQVFTMVEASEFIRVDGAWRYDHGHIVEDIQMPERVAKVGRNDPCPCGSGTKFKKCCGK
ncbi:MAG: hypothetical protein EON60_08095 [Alphaproteobacteria bacterium]|nr:MAG: hypothetical protein EON60_08095 [Alphaproteobacteria bacterium]